MKNLMIAYWTEIKQKHCYYIIFEQLNVGRQ